MRLSFRWFLVLLLLAVSSSASAQKNCKKGIPCGNGCISAKKTCHIAQSNAPRRSTAQLANPADTARGPWVASARGKVYYRSTCSAANKLAPKNRVYFPSEDVARKAGYAHSRSKGC